MFGFRFSCLNLLLKSGYLLRTCRRWIIFTLRFSHKTALISISFVGFDSLFILFFPFYLVLRLRIRAILIICISVSDLASVQCGVYELGTLGDEWEFHFVCSH